MAAVGGVLAETIEVLELSEVALFLEGTENSAAAFTAAVLLLGVP